MMFLSNFTGCF